MIEGTTPAPPAGDAQGTTSRRMALETILESDAGQTQDGFKRQFPIGNSSRRRLLFPVP